MNISFCAMDTKNGYFESLYFYCSSEKDAARLKLELIIMQLQHKSFKAYEIKRHD
jgi:hypothetical protein